MSELDKKNAAAVFQAIRAMEQKLLAQQTKIDTLNTTVSNLLRRLDEMDAKYMTLKISTMGSGATVK